MRAQFDAPGGVMITHRRTEATVLTIAEAKSLRADMDKAIAQAEAIACPTCKGKALTFMGGRWVTCPACSGSGRRPEAYGRGAEG